jgi:hypothetical protein
MLGLIIGEPPMFGFLTKQKYPAILLALGFILVLTSFFKIEDITKLQISPNAAPIYATFVIGIALIVLSIVIFLLGEDGEGWLRPVKIKRLGKGHTTKIGQATLNVIYGKIQDYNTDAFSVVVLPANEFFDDECLHDEKSSLGAYMQSKFSNQIDEIKQLIKAKLEGLATIKVKKEEGLFQHSYGTGKSIFLDHPLKSSHRIILTAVTSQRAGEGLRGEISFNFRAVQEVYKIIADKRVRKVYFPLLGAGHGCLGDEVALFSLVLAWAEILCKPVSPHLEVNIIIFQPDETTKPEPNPRVVKRIIRMAIGMFKK